VYAASHVGVAQEGLACLRRHVAVDRNRDVHHLGKVVQRDVAAQDVVVPEGRVLVLALRRQQHHDPERRR